MKRIIHTVAVAMALASALPVAAQQSTKPFIGLGVGLPTSELGTVAGVFGIDGGVVAPQLYVPINVLPNLRIEPQIGFLTWSDDATGDERSFWSIGTGAFWLMPLAESVNMYVGPRLVLAFFKEEEPTGIGVQKRSATDVLLAAALGGEAFLHPRLSLGAEGQIGYTWLGDVEETSETGQKSETPGGSSLATQGILFVRVYLF